MEVKKYQVNIVLGNLIRAFEYAGNSYASPQRKVAKIVKSQTYGNYPIPTSYLELECGHSAKAIVKDQDYALAHTDSNHIATPGDLIGCSYCRYYDNALAQLKALDPSTLSHSRFRHRDSRGFGPGDLYVYVRDTTSPTQCKLLLSIDNTDEANELLRKLSASPLSPTEKR